jgi:hypothetical protein
VDDYKEVVPQLMVDVVSMVTAEFLPKALPRLPAPLSVAGHLGQGLSELETTGESSHRCSLDIDAPMPMATMLGNYKPNYSGEEHRGRVFYEPREVFLGNYVDQQFEFFGGGRFGKVSLPDISILDMEHASVFLGNSTTIFSSPVFAQRELTTTRSVPAEENFDFEFCSSFQSLLAPDSVCPGVPRVSQPDSPDVFVARPSLELFSVSSRQPLLELKADRADQAASRTSPAKVQLPQEVPPEPPPLTVCSLLALPSPSVLFSLVNFVTLEQLLTVSCSDNIVTLENSTTDPLFREPFVAALMTTVGDFSVLQHNLGSTAGCCFSKMVDVSLNNSCSAVYSDQLPCPARRATTLLNCFEQTVGNSSAFPNTEPVVIDIVFLQFWISNVTFQPRRLLDLVATTLCNSNFGWLLFSFLTLVFSCFNSNRSFNDVNFNWKCSIQASYRDSAAEPYLRFVVGVSYAKLRLAHE